MNLCLRRSFAVGRYKSKDDQLIVSPHSKKTSGTNLLGIPLQTQRNESTEIPRELRSKGRRRVLGDEEENLERARERDERVSGREDEEREGIDAKAHLHRMQFSVRRLSHSELDSSDS